jgi:hypothetical protein
LELLKENIEPQKPFILLQRNAYSKPYKGEIYSDGFEILRVIDYRNSFLPTIKGEIIETETGIELKVKMRMNPVVVAFLSVWLGLVFIISILTTFQLFTKEFNPLFLAPHVMLVFGLVITLTGYLEEVNVSKEDIKEIFSAEITAW